MPDIKKLLQKYQNKIDLLDLEILISEAIGKSKEFILTHPEYTLTDKQLLRFQNFVKRKLTNEPTAHIIRRKEFYGLNFTVNKHTLIPRPETELLVSEALDFLNSLQNKQALKENLCLVDVGTGSGNIIISITKNFPEKLLAKNCSLIAIDISGEALKIAKQNANQHKVADKINFLQSDLLEKFKSKNFTPTKCKPAKTSDNLVILANLPYLSTEIYNSCAKNVKSFEPKTALYSPENGLHHYKKLLQQLSDFSKNNRLKIISFFEISPEQKPAIKKLIKKYFPRAKVKFKKDLSGKWRLCQMLAQNTQPRASLRRPTSK